MPSKEWDTPFEYSKGNTEFKGETSDGGVYNDNPTVPDPTTGGFEMKFFEKMEHGPNLPLDSPMGTDQKLAGQKVESLEPTKGAAPPSENWDSPFTAKAGLMKR